MVNIGASLRSLLFAMQQVLRVARLSKSFKLAGVALLLSTRSQTFTLTLT